MDNTEFEDLFEAFTEGRCSVEEIPHKLIDNLNETEKAMFAGFICGYRYSEMLNIRVTLSGTADDVKSSTE